MDEHEKIHFQLIGEVTRDNLDDLMKHIGELGVTVRFSTEHSLVSPSIGIEYIQDNNGGYKLTVTETSVTDFLVSEGSEDPAARTMASTLMWVLMQHTTRRHSYSNASNGSPLNYYGGPSSGCSCPLEIAFGKDYFGQHNQPHGIVPESLIAFSKLSLPGARSSVKGIGIKRHQQIKNLAQRIKDDMGRKS